MGRQAAHELVRQVTMEAEKNGTSFSEEISENNKVLEKIGKKGIDKCLNPDNYTGHSSEIIDRVLNSI